MVDRHVPTFPNLKGDTPRFQTDPQLWKPVGAGLLPSRPKLSTLTPLHLELQPTPPRCKCRAVRFSKINGFCAHVGQKCLNTADECCSNDLAISLFSLALHHKHPQLARTFFPRDTWRPCMPPRTSTTQPSLPCLCCWEGKCRMDTSKWGKSFFSNPGTSFFSLGVM